MTSNKKIWTVVILVILGLGIYFAMQVSYNSIPSTNTKQSLSKLGNESLCSRGAQDYANTRNESALQFSRTSDLPAGSYFVMSSHYSGSQNSCYFELHSQLPFPTNYGGISDNYTLYVMSGPSKYLVDNLKKLFVPAMVADCSMPKNTKNIATNNITSCNFYNPIEKRSSSKNPYSYWIAQYGFKNVPPMNQQDFQALVQRDMAAN